jgi:hypothetical protein
VRKLAVSLLILILFTAPGLATLAVTTANVNFREGPGTNHRSIGVLPLGTQVEVEDCDASGRWCGITHEDRSGFVSGRYLEQTEDDSPGWPRAFHIGETSFVVLQQPQFSDWQNFTRLEALMAAEYHADEEALPIFGVIGLAANSERDVDNGTLLLTEIEITQLDFALLDRAQLTELALKLGGLLPTGTVEVLEARVTASLVNYQRVADVDVEDLISTPPRIFVSSQSAVLVQSDGAPVFAPVKGAPGVEFVINTNWDLFRVNDALWLRDDTSWLTTANFDQDWSAVESLPDALSSLPEDGNWDEARAALSPEAFEGDTPRVFFSDSPAEMILLEGDAESEDVPGTDLEWISNTEADLFRLKATGEWYYLVSGRWYQAASLEGPWTFVTPDLPGDFLNIPEDKPYYTVRAAVPGTSEATEARLRASIPTTARVEIGSVTAEVAYEGDPAFEPINGTTMSYAVNTTAQVIRVGDKYYVVQEGIWFVSDSPTGPWELANAVPDEIYTIPPTSPVYNVTYVHVYYGEDDAIWYGYTAGYLHAYLAWGSLVYGTGWLYPPYWQHGPVPIYYPRPITFGIGAYYNPTLGVYGRFGYAYGPYRGITARAVWNPATGTYARGARVYGPRGTGAFVAAFNPRTGTRAFARGGSGVYGSWGSASVRRGSEYVRASGAVTAGGTGGVRWDSSRGQGFVAGRRGNVYAGRNGSVYRNVGDGWQTWNDGGWTGVERPSPETFDRGGLQDRVGQGARDNAANRQNQGNSERASNRQNGGQQVRNRVPAHVQQDHRGRQNGNQRADRRRSQNAYGGSVNRGRANRGNQVNRGNRANRRGGGNRRGRRR